MSLTLLFSAWLLGTLGSAHCLAMCGGFAAALVSRDVATIGVALLPARTILRRQLAYHAGRLGCYALLGAVFGAAGAVVLEAASLLPLQRTLYVGANVLLLLIGASLAFGAPAVAGLQRAGARLFTGALPALSRLLRLRGATGRVALGLVWGLVPCALVYAALPLALFAGGALRGAAAMLAFGLGTVPALAAAGLAFRAPQRALGERRWRYLVASVLIAFALAGIYRAVFAGGDLPQAPFCLLG